MSGITVLIKVSWLHFIKTWVASTLHFFVIFWIFVCMASIRMDMISLFVFFRETMSWRKMFNMIAIRLTECRQVTMYLWLHSIYLIINNFVNTTLIMIKINIFCSQWFLRQDSIFFLPANCFIWILTKKPLV